MAWAIDQYQFFGCGQIVGQKEFKFMKNIIIGSRSTAAILRYDVTLNDPYSTWYDCLDKLFTVI